MSALSSAAVGPATVAMLLIVAVVCTVTDLLRKKIYNAVTYPAAALGFALQIHQHGISGVSIAVAGFAVGFLPTFLLFALGGMGGGDVKLMGAIGAAAGAVAAVETMLLAFLFGALIAIGTLVWQGQLWRTLWGTARRLAGMIVPGLPRAPSLPESAVRWMHFGTAISLGLVATLWDLRSGALSSLI